MQTMIHRSLSRAAILLLILGYLGSLSAQSTSPAHQSRNNVALTDLIATDLDGRPFDPAVLAGKVVLLDFWATWCAPCLEAFPALKQIQKELGEDGFQVVSVTLYSGSASDLEWVMDKYKPNHQVVIGESRVPITYGIIGFPTYLLMGKDGRLVRRYVGDFENPLGRALEDARALLNDESLAEVTIQ